MTFRGFLLTLVLLFLLLLIGSAILYLYDSPSAEAAPSPHFANPLLEAIREVACRVVGERGVRLVHHA